MKSRSSILLEFSLALIIIAIAFTFSGCDTVQNAKQYSEAQLNTMTVVLNDSICTLNSVDCSGGYWPLGIEPSCSGVLRGKELSIYMKFGDTVNVGTREINNFQDTMIYTIQYDSSETLINSGIIGAGTYGHNNSTRAKGIFKFDAIRNDETLRFRNGQFDVYVRSID